MREIKFRAWDSDFKIMTYDVQKPINVGIDSLYFHHFLQECFDLMQYTGLKDKNGKEIYEGDIVNHGHNYPLVVIWDDDYYWLDGPGFCLKETGNKNGIRYHGLPGYTSPIEVLGNIYENPELLDK
jgi:uncharacterized phage protein (TIGR01671 family)